MQRRIHNIQEPEIQIKTGKGWQQGPGRQQAEIISKQSRTGQWQRSGVYPRVRTQGVGGKKTYTVATWRNKWQSTSVFLPGKFHGQRSLAGYSPWSGNESDTTERTYRVKVKSLSLCDPMDCSLPGSSIHGIFQARVLEWVAISFSRGSSRPRDRTPVSCIVGRRFTVWATYRVVDIFECWQVII